MYFQEQFAKDVFKAVDSMNGDAFAKFFTPQGSFTFANSPAVTGRENIAAAVNGFFGAIQGIKHICTGVWTDGDAMIVRSMVTYTRKDGKVLDLDCCNVWKIAGNEIAEYHIYMDVNPVFA